MVMMHAYRKLRTEEVHVSLANDFESNYLHKRDHVDFHNLL